jgi:copper chaperone
MSDTRERIVVTTPDMSCGHCVATIEREVAELDGVDDVDADLATKQVTIAFDPSVLTVAQLEATLDDAGYPVAR